MKNWEIAKWIWEMENNGDLTCVFLKNSLKCPHRAFTYLQQIPEDKQVKCMQSK